MMEADEAIFIVSELASGNLFNYISMNGHLNEDDARRFFRQVALAVQYMHSHKIIHRDIKCENILLVKTEESFNTLVDNDDKLGEPEEPFDFSPQMTDTNDFDEEEEVATPSLTPNLANTTVNSPTQMEPLSPVLEQEIAQLNLHEPTRSNTILADSSTKILDDQTVLPSYGRHSVVTDPRPAFPSTINRKTHTLHSSMRAHEHILSKRNHSDPSGFRYYSDPTSPKMMPRSDIPDEERVALDPTTLPEFTAKLGDFGLSQEIKEDSEKCKDERSYCVGSLHYCSPEEIRQQATLDPSMDIWSLGCVLYTMLTGKLPFNDDFLPRLQYTIISGKYDKECFNTLQLSEEAIDLVTKMLSVPKEDRPLIDQVLLHPWLTS